MIYIWFVIKITSTTIFIPSCQFYFQNWESNYIHRLYFKLDDFIYRNGRISLNNLLLNYLVRQIPTTNSESTNQDFRCLLFLRTLDFFLNREKKSWFVDSGLVVGIWWSRYRFNNHLLYIFQQIHCNLDNNV